MLPVPSPGKEQGETRKQVSVETGHSETPSTGAGRVLAGGAKAVFVLCGFVYIWHTGLCAEPVTVLGVTLCLMTAGAVEAWTWGQWSVSLQGPPRSPVFLWVSEAHWAPRSGVWLPQNLIMVWSPLRLGLS